MVHHHEQLAPHESQETPYTAHWEALSQAEGVVHGEKITQQVGKSSVGKRNDGLGPAVATE